MNFYTAVYHQNTTCLILLLPIYKIKYFKGANIHRKNIHYLWISFHHFTCHKDEIPEQGSANNTAGIKSAQFCIVKQARTRFTFLNSVWGEEGRNQKEDYFTIHENYVKFKFQCP